MLYFFKSLTPNPFLTLLTYTNTQNTSSAKNSANNTDKRIPSSTSSPAGSVKSVGRSSKNSSPPASSSQGRKKSTTSSPNNSKPASPSSMSKSVMTLNGNQGDKKYCNSCGGNGKNMKPGLPGTQFALNGRAASHQHIEVIHMQQSSTLPSDPDDLANATGPTHPLNFRSLQCVQERSQSVPRQNGGTSSTGDTSPTNNSNNSPCELKVRNDSSLLNIPFTVSSRAINVFNDTCMHGLQCNTKEELLKLLR